MTKTTLPASESPRASVVVLSKGNADGLQACVTSLERNIGTEVACEVILLLNGADEDVTAVVDQELVGAEVERCPVNLGFPAGCNRAASHARGEFLVLLNDDTEIEPGWLESLIGAADEHPKAGAIGSRILFPDRSVQEAGCVIWRDGTTAQIGRGLRDGGARHLYVRQVDYCSAASLLVRRSTWDALGGFDEDYFPGYYEDVDLCLAIRERGEQVLYEPRSRVVHHESATLDAGMKALVAGRNMQRLRSKWSAALSAHEPGGAASAARVERAALRAEGWPRRILLVSKQLPDAGLVGELRSISAAITVLIERGSGDDLEPLARRGCDIIEGSLSEHLEAPETLYDTIILSGQDEFGSHVGAISQLQPAAAVIHDADGQRVEPGTWPRALAAAKSRRVHEYV